MTAIFLHEMESLFTATDLSETAILAHGPPVCSGY